jgi:hypothetical protein
MMMKSLIRSSAKAEALSRRAPLPPLLLLSAMVLPVGGWAGEVCEGEGGTFGSTAGGVSAVACGNGNTASGDSAQAFGENNLAEGDGSVAFGANNQAPASRQVPLVSTTWQPGITAQRWALTTSSPARRASAWAITTGSMDMSPYRQRHLQHRNRHHGPGHRHGIAGDQWLV